MDVYVSESIVSLLSLEQGDEVITVEQETGYLHIEEVEGKLNVYIPKNKKSRRVCFAQILPIALLKHFGVPNLANGTNLGNILVVGSLFEVDQLLRCTGIIEVEGIERPDVEDVSDDESCASDDGHSSSRAFTSVVTSNRSYSSPGHITPASTFSGETSIKEWPELYKQLLDALTAQAEAVAADGLPTKDTYGIAKTPASHGLATALAVASNVEGEQNFKKGAAGELFVS